MSSHLRITFIFVVFAFSAVALFAACNDDGDGLEPPSSTTTPSGTPSGTPTLPPFPPVPFEGTRDKIEQNFTHPVETSPILEGVTKNDRGPFDRLEFFFDFGIPNYTIEYVDGPITACGSGLPVEIAGTRYLQIRMTNAFAHTESGEPSITNRDEVINLPSIIQLTMTCDFEGEVTWIAGLTEEVNFKTLPITFPLAQHAILVDVNHPGRD